MKIYNEVVIDMNPESSSYGETLHEDSYEYEGDMMLAYEDYYYDSDSPPDGFYDTVVSFSDKDEVIYSRSGNAVVDQQKPNSIDEAAINNQIQAVARSLAAKYGGTPGSVKMGAGMGVAVGDHAPRGEFTYTGGEFDPTSEEVKKSVQETGDYSQLLEGYGYAAGDIKFFDQPKMDELGYITEDYRIKQRELAEGLRSAQSTYDIGVESTSLKAGRDLASIKEEADVSRSRSKLATIGEIDTKQKTSGKGIWQDYTQQQKALSSQMVSAQSTFDTGQTRADLTKRRAESAFWEDIETDFYSTVSDLG